MTDTKMPEWPSLPPRKTECTRLDLMGALAMCGDIVNYERARADAWEARCRVAVKTLEAAYGYFVHYQGEVDGHFHAAHDGIFEALEVIGELPTPLPGEGE